MRLLTGMIVVNTHLKGRSAILRASPMSHIGLHRIGPPDCAASDHSGDGGLADVDFGALAFGCALVEDDDVSCENGQLSPREHVPFGKRRQGTLGLPPGFALADGGLG